MTLADGAFSITGGLFANAAHKDLELTVHDMTDLALPVANLTAVGVVSLLKNVEVWPGPVGSARLPPSQPYG